MQGRVIRERIHSSYPDVFLRRKLLGNFKIDGLNVSKFEGSYIRQKSPHFGWNMLEHVLGNVGQVLEAVRTWHIGHLKLMRESNLGVLKRSREIQDWSTVLNGDHTAIGKTATISGSIMGATFITFLPRMVDWASGFLPFISDSLTEGVLTAPQVEEMLFGALIIVFLIVEPLGLYGLWIRIRNYFKAWPFSY